MPAPAYDGFLSYSHDDREVAALVQRAVSRYATSRLRRQRLTLFRDDTSLSADPDLWRSIEQRGLERSRWFVLLASPAAAASPSVNREIGWWLRHRGPDTLLIGLLDGTLAWEPDGRGFSPASTASPPALDGLAAEPHWIDLRGLRWSRRRTRRDPAVARIVAPLSGRALEDVIGEDNRYLRRSRGLAWSAAGLLAVLAVLAGVLTVATVRAQDQVIARAMASRSEAAAARDPRAALRYGVAALHFDPGPEMADRLVRTVLTSPVLGTTSGQRGTLPGLAVSADGTLLATGSADGSVLLWALDGPAPPRRLGDPIRGTLGAVDAVALDPAGRTLAVTGRGGTPGVGAELWDVADRSRPRALARFGGDPGGVNQVSFVRGGSMLVTGGGTDGAARFWDLGGRPAAPPVPLHEGGLTGLDVSPDGRLLATAGADGRATLTDVTDPARPRTVPLGARLPAMFAVRFDPSGRVLAVAGSDRRIVLWDVSDPARPRPWPSPIGGLRGIVTDLAFTRITGAGPTSVLLAAAGGDGGTTVVDVTDPARPGEQRGTLSGHTTTVLRARFLPSGRQLVTTGGDGTAILWDVTSGVDLGPDRDLPGHTDQVRWARFSPDGRLVADGGADAVVVVRDTRTGATVARLTTDHLRLPTSGAFLGDSAHLAIGASDGTVEIRPPAGGPVTTLDTGGVGPVVAVRVTGGRMVTAGADGTVVLWDVTDPTAVRRLGALPPDVLAGTTTAALLGDGSTLLVGGTRTGSRLTLWDVRDPAAPRRLPDPSPGPADGISALDVARDVPLAATGGVDHSIVLWDVSDPAAPRMLGRPAAAGDGAVAAVALSADGRTLYTATTDGAAVFSDLTDPARPAPIGGRLRRLGFTTTASWAPDGPRLLLGGQDRTVTLVDLARAERVRRDPVAGACARAGGPLDAAAWADVAPGTGWVDTCPG